MSTKWGALILAGSRGASDPVAQAAGVPVKALAELAGRPMIAHVVEALAACPLIGEISVSIEADAPDLPVMAASVQRLDAGATPATSTLDAASQLGAPLLITTADNPLLTVEMLTEFLNAVQDANADIAAGLAPRHLVEQAGNPGKRTYLRFREGGYSGCNLFALRTTSGESAISFWKQLETERKRPWRMARKIGIWTLIRYLSGQLTRARAVAALTARTGCATALIDVLHPNAAHDVDKASDLAFAKRVLAGER